MKDFTGKQAWHPARIILLSIELRGNVPMLNFFYDGASMQAVLRNPEDVKGNMISGTELEAVLYSKGGRGDFFAEAELLLNDSDFLPGQLCGMLDSFPPVLATHFGIISNPDNSGAGRYYMLRDCNRDGLSLCTGRYRLRAGKGCCEDFDGQWHFRYEVFENFFYGSNRPESEIARWKHPAIRLKKIDDNITYKDLTKSFRDYAAGWHRYNFFCTDDWSLRFYRRQAKLGYIAITHTVDGVLKLTPQLQREYAVLDWDDLVIDKKVRKIISSGRIDTEDIRLSVEPDPAEVLEHLGKQWNPTWITVEYEELITRLAFECRQKKIRNFRLWGVTLSVGKCEVVAGELGYSIGKTYTSLSGFFHRENRKYNNFGKLQMVLLAERLQKAGYKFWNLGQPYMEYKIKLGAAVVPRGLFLKRWDKAARGRVPELED